MVIHVNGCEPIDEGNEVQADARSQCKIIEKEKEAKTTPKFRNDCEPIERAKEIRPNNPSQQMSVCHPKDGRYQEQ